MMRPIGQNRLGTSAEPVLRLGEPIEAAKLTKSILVNRQPGPFTLTLTRMVHRTSCQIVSEWDTPILEEVALHSCRRKPDGINKKPNRRK